MATLYCGLIMELIYGKMTSSEITSFSMMSLDVQWPLIFLKGFDVLV